MTQSADAQRSKPVRWWVWTLGGTAALLLIAFTLVVAPWIFTRYPHHGLTAEQELKAKNDVRTTLVQALAGLAVAGGAYVTYRTYRQNQRDQEARRAEQDRLYQFNLAEQTARQAEQDRLYRLNLAEQVNALFTKAVEQLGHAEAPVRLGALYSLERLAQDNPDQRQTVVDVFCAYLRMPFNPPADVSTAAPDAAVVAEHARPAAHPGAGRRDPAQELQVRRTAQRMLCDHLRAEASTFWPNIRLDLAGAVLIDFIPMGASGTSVGFQQARFIGATGILESTFRFGDFTDAYFTDWADFGSAQFSWAHFQGATFAGPFVLAGPSKRAQFDHARVLHLDDPNLAPQRDLPTGWTIRPDADDPTRGTMVRVEAAEESSQSEFPPKPTSP